jgi:prepilin-type N-terminal cleavage/methylation domain-containing protein
MDNYHKTGSAKNTMSLKKTTSSAFTLIELLITITIIALLLAVLVPALRKARSQTRATICMSNLKQWSISYQLYATDNNSKYPAADPQDTTQTWMTKLSMYCSDIQSIRNCPCATKVNVNEVGQIPTGILGTTKKAWYLTPPFDLSPQYRTGSYAENIYIAQPRLEMEMDPDSEGSPTLSNFWSGPEDKGAGQTPLLIDARWYIIAPEETQPLPSDGKIVVNNTTKTWVDSAAMKRHKDGVNTLFLSGSIIKVDAEELWNLRWHKNYTKRGKVPLPNMGNDT